MANIALAPGIVDKKYKQGSQPPSLAGKYIEIIFGDYETFEKRFIKQSIRFPSCMYKWHRDKSRADKRECLKPYIESEYNNHHSLKAYVHGKSKFISTVPTRKQIRHNVNTVSTIEGYQYYTLEFTFLSGQYSETCDVLLFEKVVEKDEAIANIYWELYSDSISLEVIKD